MRKKREIVDFSHLLIDKRVPIVILDERWHQLFHKQSKSRKIIELEKTLNNLMKQQGKLISDVKNMKSAKRQLMDGIVANMNVDSSPTGKLNDKKLAKSHKLIEDINNKLNNADNNLADIPYRIKETNANLVVEGMNLCYRKLDKNSSELTQLDQKIEMMREELKQMIGRKQDLESDNAVMYTYMHDVLGSEVMEMLDQYYKKRK